MEIKKNLILAIALINLLTGCGGQPGDKKEPTQPQLLSELNLQDDGLKACIAGQAEANKWTRVDQVVSLDCEFLNKMRIGATQAILEGEPLPDSFDAIKETGELNLFTNLINLRLPGHLYTAIDLSSLTKLENLDLSNAFIQELNLQKNTRLVSVTLTGTGLDKLDLTGLKDLKKLNVAFQGKGSDWTPYQTWILEHGAKIYSFDLDRFITPNIKMTFDPETLLQTIEASNSTLIDLVHNQELLSVRGQVTQATLTNAINLKSLVGSIRGFGTLDLSSMQNLHSIEISNPEFDAVILPDNMEDLFIYESMKKITATKNSKLTSLTIYGSGENNTNTQFGRYKTDLNQFKLRYLSLGYFKGEEMLDLSDFSTLKELVIFYSDFKTIYLPNSVTSANLQTSPVQKMSPVEQLTHLTLDGCPFENATFSELTHLKTYGCKTETFGFDSFPKLSSLEISDATIDTLDFSLALNLNELWLSLSTFNNIDLTPLYGRKMNALSFQGNQIPNASELELQVKEIYPHAY